MFPACFAPISHISMPLIEWYHPIMTANFSAVSVWPLQATVSHVPVLDMTVLTFSPSESLENEKNTDLLSLASSFHLEDSFDHYKGSHGPSFRTFGEVQVPELRGRSRGSS